MALSVNQERANSEDSPLSNTRIPERVVLAEGFLDSAVKEEAKDDCSERIR